MQHLWGTFNARDFLIKSGGPSETSNNSSTSFTVSIPLKSFTAQKVWGLQLAMRTGNITSGRTLGGKRLMPQLQKMWSAKEPFSISMMFNTGAIHILISVHTLIFVWFQKEHIVKGTAQHVLTLHFNLLNWKKRGNTTDMILKNVSYCHIL